MACSFSLTIFNNFIGAYCPKGLDTNGTLGTMLHVGENVNRPQQRDCPISFREVRGFFLAGRWAYIQERQGKQDKTNVLLPILAPCTFHISHTSSDIHSFFYNA